MPTVTVVVDLAQLKRQHDRGVGVRNWLWDVVEPLPAGTHVRLLVGNTLPTPMVVDGLRLNHVCFDVEGTTFRAASAWATLLEQAQR